MGVKLIPIVDLIFENSPLSFPLANYYLEEGDNSFYKPFLKIFLCYRLNKPNEGLTLVNTNIHIYKNRSQNLFYATLLYKMIFLKKTGNEKESKFVFFTLKKHVHKMSKKCRNFIKPYLSNHQILLSIYSEKFIFRHKTFDLTKIIKALHYLIYGNRNFLISDYKDFINHCLSTYTFYNEFSFVYTRTERINNFVLALTNYNSLECQHMAQNFLYEIFYSYEDVRIIFENLYILYFFFNKNIYKHHILRIFLYFDNDLKKINSDFIKIKKILLTEALNISKKRYSLEDNLCMFLDNSNFKKGGICKKTLYNIKNKKNMSLNSVTLNKIIEKHHLKQDFSFSTYNEAYKKKIIHFEKEKILNLFVTKKDSLLFTFSALINRKKNFPYLSENFCKIFFEYDIFQLLKIESYEFLEFLFFTDNPEPFIKARFILAQKFFVSLNHSSEKFIYNYLKIDERKKEIMEVFIRNYSRYFMFSNTKIKKDNPILNYLNNNYLLMPSITYLSFWCFPKKTQHFFEKIISCDF